MGEPLQYASNEIVEFYATTGVETARLEEPVGWLEKLRTLELLKRHLPPPPALLLDIGGATGVYARPLAHSGYRVHLIDLVAEHVAAAREVASQAGKGSPAGFLQGDALRLSFADGCADAAMLMGPLYHLTESPERAQALRDAFRCLRPGGLLCAAAISRFASLLDGFRAGHVEDEEFLGILDRDLREGQHRNPTANRGYFTTAYFHRPEELRRELTDAGCTNVVVYGVEGPAWIAPRLTDYMSDAVLRDRTMDLVRRVEREPELIGMSAHLLAFGWKPGRR